MGVWEDKGIRFEVIPPERVDEAMDFLMEHFFPDEPICSSLGFERDSIWFPYLTSRMKSFILQKLSLMAVDESTGKIVAVRISKAAYKDEKNPWLPATYGEELKFRCASLLRFVWGAHERLEKWKVVIDYLEFLCEKEDVFKKYGTDKIYDMFALCTAKDARLKGIGTEIIKRSLELARNNGFKAARTEATSNFSQKIFENLGFDCLYEIEYTDYLKDGEMVFKNTGIHKRTKFFGIGL